MRIFTICYSYQTLIRITKTNRVRYAGYIAQTGKKKEKCVITFWLENMQGIEHLGDRGVRWKDLK
jgi:hypothetical protein